MIKKEYSRIVFKFGTGVLSTQGGLSLDREQFHRIACETATIKNFGIQIVYVSSGAVAAGLPLLGLMERPNDLPTQQACAAIGQPVLMDFYCEFLGNYGFAVAQLLLSHSDIDSRIRRSNARNTLERLLQSPNVVPIINENDSVAVEELRFGDNDRLSAEVAALIDADLLAILTSVDGLFDSNSQLIDEVFDITQAFQYVNEETGKFSVGGMRTKLEAVRIAA
ncbi:MAG: glutamate 5-kinase, partial [Chthoniobacterales bacterium]|nr:glutamate 5-kinase [Chthoniobacterales bacterium]